MTADPAAAAAAAAAGTAGPVDDSADAAVDATADAAVTADAAAAASADAADAAAAVRAETELAAQLEALLIVADEPLAPVELATAVQRPIRQVTAELARLRADYDAGPRGFELREVAGGYRFYARERFDPLITDFMQERSVTRLSQAALETLTVVAYRQPITRGQIASIRAVNVDSVVRTLVGRGLITEVGHDPETGATQYGTTQQLLEHLGVSSLDELPPVAPLLDDGSEGFDREQF